MRERTTINHQLKRKYIFNVERLNANHTFAFTNSSHLINYNISLLRLANHVLLSKIDFAEADKMHFINLGRYIIVLRVNEFNVDMEMLFISFDLPNKSLMHMNEIFTEQELGVILALKQKMIETYNKADESIAEIAIASN